jgi:hypothetical protein
MTKNVAILDENNKILNVILCNEDYELKEYEVFYTDENPAFIGGDYDPDANAFIAPRPECGHKELFLNDNFNWNCQRCDLDAKALRDEA